MAQDLSNFIPELWSARVQKLREKILIAKAICNYEEQAGLSFGDKVHRPRPVEFVVNDYVRNVDPSQQEYGGTDEYMDIDRSKEVSFYIDLLDKKQSKYDIEMEAVKKAVYAVRKEMDAHLLSKVLDSSFDSDAEQAGGSAGTPYAPVVSTLSTFVENSKAILAANDVEDDRPRYWVVTPKVVGVIANTFVQNGFNTADSTLKNGYQGDFAGLKIYKSTNVLHTQTATLDTVIATDAIVIAGITLTVVSTIGKTAGNVLVGANDTATAANIAALINAPDTTTEKGVALSEANIKKIKKAGIYATSDGAVLTIYGSGAFVASTPDTTITLGTLTAHCEMGRMGATDFVTQLEPLVQKNKDPKKSGYNWLILDLYGAKKFTEGKETTLDAKIAG